MSNSDQNPRIFFCRLGLFLVPFCALVVIIIGIDPFNYFQLSGLISTNIKQNTAQKYFPPLWRMIDYARKRSPNILLGDSRFASINSEDLRNITGKEYYNLAFGGGTFPEIRDAFWFATSRAKLSSVYINLDIQLMNGLIKRHRTLQSIRIIENPFYYFIDRRVLMSAAYALYAQLCNNEFIIGKPRQMTKDEFWKIQIETNARADLENFLYPLDNLEELRRIARYCFDCKIHLIFVVMPSHIDLLKKIKELGLAEYDQKIRSELAEISALIDLSGESQFNSDLSNFSDPYHLTKDALLRILPCIWASADTRDAAGNK
jgi:hypothetical protein